MLGACERLLGDRLRPAGRRGLLAKVRLGPPGHRRPGDPHRIVRHRGDRGDHAAAPRLIEIFADKTAHFDKRDFTVLLA